MNKVKKWIPPVIPLHSDLPTWKALFNDVHDNLIEAGLVQTNDLGQLDIDAVAELPADGTFAGHRIYRFNDALQAECPIFIKVEFGCGVEGLSGFGSSYDRTQTPRIRFSAGTGVVDEDLVNPSGQFSNPQHHNQSGAQQSSQNNTYGTSYFCMNEDQGFFAFFYGVGSRNKPFADAYGSYYGSTLSILIQRDTNADGTPNGDGFAMWAPGFNSTNRVSNLWDDGVLHAGMMQYVSKENGTTVVTRQAALRPFGNSNINPQDDIFFHPVFFVTTENIVKQWPSVVTYRVEDVAEGSEFTLDMQGFSPRNFCAMGNEHSIAVDQIVGQRAGIAILFEGD